MVNPSELFCPRCRQPLVQADAQGIALHGCGRCGGIWLSNQDSQRVVAALSPEVKALSEAAAKHAREKPELEQKVQCPVCRFELKRTWPVTGIGLDVCTAHGTWFDAGELHRAVHAMRMEKAYGHVNQAARKSAPQTPAYHEYGGTRAEDELFDSGALGHSALFARTLGELFETD